MEAGKYQPIKLFLETDVDQALSAYPLQIKAWWYPAFKKGYLLIDPDPYEGYIRRVANYRKTHPNPIKEDMFDKVPPEKSEYHSEYKEMATGIREYKKRINDTVNMYAEKESASPLFTDAPGR